MAHPATLVRPVRPVRRCYTRIEVDPRWPLHSPPLRTYNVVIIEGDGIGPELVSAALRVLNAVQERAGGFRLELDFREGGAELYRREGYNLATQSLQAIMQADAMMKGPWGCRRSAIQTGRRRGRWAAC